MKAVILAGGLGERLRPLTEMLPKPLLPLGENSVLEIIIKKLRSFGVEHIYLATNYKSGLFEETLGDGSKYGVNITYSKEDKKLGTAGPLALLKEHLDEPFFVMNGDIITLLNFFNLMEFHKDNNADLTLVTKTQSLPCDYGIVKSEGHNILNIEEKPRINIDINAGIYVISPKILQLIPSDERYNMNELIVKAINNNHIVKRYHTEDYWLDIGQFKDYEKAKQDINKII